MSRKAISMNIGQEYFDDCCAELLDAEGGWTVDSGGETFRGITRRTWEGKTEWLWEKIDALKEDGDNEDEIKAKVNAALKGNPEVDDFVRAFYMDNYWKRSCSDQIKYKELACTHLSIFVNVERRGGKALQNLIATLVPDYPITIDCVIGKQTRAGIVKLNDLDLDADGVENARRIYREYAESLLRQEYAGADLEGVANRYKTA